MTTLDKEENLDIKNTFSKETLEKISKLREKAQNRILNRPKGSVIVEKTWMIDDSELNYIPIPLKKINVLSLFDGLSCGQIALNRLGINFSKYYASEVDKNAIIVAKANNKNMIHIGDIRLVDVSKLEPIDLLIGGSPCQSFSFAGKKNGMTTKENIEITTLEQYLELKNQKVEFEGQSYLFWEYVRILTDIRKYNPKVKFLLENVVMKKNWEDIITNTLGVKPIKINSTLVSAQNRERLYWTNISDKIEQPINKNLYINDILDINNDKIKVMDLNDIEFTKSLNDIINIKKGTSDKSYFYEQNFYLSNSKTRTLKAGGGSGNIPKVVLKIENNKIYFKNLSPLECERLQTIPENYTNCVANTHRYKMIGNGWTIDVICHILNYLKKEMN